MTDTPPDWVLLEAVKRSELSNDTPRQRAILFDTNPSFRALCGMILEHEDFRQEVSDIVYAHVHVTRTDDWEKLKTLIIPKPKPDPLVGALNEALGRSQDYEDHDADALRATLDALGFEIREKNDD